MTTHRSAACALAAVLSCAAPASAQSAEFVQDGVPREAAYEPLRWRSEAGAFAATDAQAALLAMRRPSGAAFTLHVELRDTKSAGIWLDDELLELGELPAATSIELVADAEGCVARVGGEERLRRALAADRVVTRIALASRGVPLRIVRFALQGESVPLAAELVPGSGEAGPAMLDLAGDEARRSVVDREAKQYLGHPTTVLLEDGKTILCVYPKGHGKGAILLKRSTDGGRSWSPRLPVPENWASSLETPTIHRTVDREGRRRLVLFSGLYPIRSAVSDDDGETWTELAPIGEFGGIVAMGSVARLRDGRYAAWFHDDGRFIRAGAKPQKPARFTLYQTLSEDGGLSWSPPTAIWSGASMQLCEPGVVRSPEGGTLALLLRENSRAWRSQVVFSTDEGASWSAPIPLAAALTGDRHVAQWADDGRLVVTFRDMDAASPTRGDWVVWVGSWQDLVGGGGGQHRVRLMDNQNAWDCGYPGLEKLPDGSFVATSYGHWVAGEAPFVVSVRFALAEFATPRKD
ncbi:MAG: exo-alpha-sialidase [Planctomycetes bacterium]|nr:exo-alpha-sialidase [Planctomycetota bacterium]